MNKTVVNLEYIKALGWRLDGMALTPAQLAKVELGKLACGVAAEIHGVQRAPERKDDK